MIVDITVGTQRQSERMKKMSRIPIRRQYVMTAVSTPQLGAIFYCKFFSRIVI